MRDRADDRFSLTAAGRIAVLRAVLALCRLRPPVASTGERAGIQAHRLRLAASAAGRSSPAPDPEEERERRGTAPRLHGLASLRPLGQLRDSFILAVNQEGLWIIDQHVAHERVLFERVLRERQVEQVERQRLLMPMLLDLLPAQMVTFAAHRPGAGGQWL